MKKSLIAIFIIGLILVSSNALSQINTFYITENHNEEDPDFIVNSLVLKKCRCPYGYIIKVKINNIGAEIENTVVKVKVELDSEESIIFIEYNQGTGISIEHTTHLEIDRFKKSHIAIAEVDPPYENHPRGEIIESNEDNNILTETFTKNIEKKLGEAVWLGTMNVNLSYEISDYEIIILDKTYYSDEEYYIDLSINFDIPYNDFKKVKIWYEIFAKFPDDDPRPPISQNMILWEDEFIETNGYQENIYINKTTWIKCNNKLGDFLRYGKFSIKFYMSVKIKVFELINDEWIEVDNNRIQIRDYIDGILSGKNTRTYSKSYLNNWFYERFPLFQQLLNL